MGKEIFKLKLPESLDEMTTASMVPVFKPVAPFPSRGCTLAVEGREAERTFGLQARHSHGSQFL